MKIQLYFVEGTSLSGYLNISPLIEQDTDTEMNVDCRNLDAVACDAEVSELIVHNVLGYIPPDQVSVVLDNWVRKLRKGGKIIIVDLDAYQVSKAFVQFNIDIDKFNGLLYGNQNLLGFSRATCLTLTGLSNHLSNVYKLKIIKKRIEDLGFVLEAVRV